MTIQEFEPHMAQGPAKKNAKNDEGNQLSGKKDKHQYTPN